MYFPSDPVVVANSLLKKRQLDPLRICAYLAVFAFSLWMFAWEYQFPATDLRVHATIASEFNFVDLHSITSRMAYPFWHLCVALLYQLGMPLIWASSVVCAVAKVLGMFLAILLLTIITEDKINKNFITLAGILLMFVTGIRIPGFNEKVYQGVGSPTVWHNPTQLAVTVSMLLSALTMTTVVYLAYVLF